jgi:hypothetical protein
VPGLKYDEYEKWEVCVFSALIGLFTEGIHPLRAYFHHQTQKNIGFYVLKSTPGWSPLGG